MVVGGTEKGDGFATDGVDDGYDGIDVWFGSPDTGGVVDVFGMTVGVAVAIDGTLGCDDDIGVEVGGGDG